MNYRRVCEVFILIGIIVLLAIYLAVRSINRTYIRPINEVTYATSLIADGYYHVRVPESNVKETKALFVTTNDLARRLQKLNNKQNAIKSIKNNIRKYTKFSIND